MCGIYLSTLPYSAEQVERKLARFKFRGPDYSAIKNIDNIFFGHNRLSIIDLDPRSSQPFVYQDISIVFNGEIYNFLEIKERLKLLGYTFRTTSDTEVICAAYLEYGEKCLEYFNGMFAFVIYDSAKKRLFGARDRLGKKPFYYTLHNGKYFECSSQLAAIKMYNHFEISNEALFQYYNWGYVPEPNSIYKDVFKLPAGTFFTYDLLSKDFKFTKFWDIPSPERFMGSYTDAKVHLDELLTDAVKIRMLSSDVPLGVFLSGGIDSSLISSIASKISETPVKTFCVKFNSKKFDESEHAAAIARHLGTDHFTIECDIDREDSLLEDFSYFYDEPFADSSALPSLLLAKYTKQHVTVALSGDGGDEFFLGYARYNNINKVHPLYKGLSVLRKPIGSLLNLSSNYKAKIISQALLNNSTIEELYVNNVTSLDKTWYSSPLKLADVEYVDSLYADNKSLLERISDFDIKTYMNNDIITKVDRASMAFSLEVRSPLMDYRILEFAKSLPLDFKFNGKDQKVILKDLLHNYVPKAMFDRPKSGFSVPLNEWFRGKLKSYVYDTLTKANIEQFPGINYKMVQNMIEQHMVGKWNRSVEIWKLIVLINWKKTIDSE